jgi:DNA-directed RNA polymerase specialized sigma24 family protein
MKVKPHIDFHAVEPGHLAIHDRLGNWSRWVQVRRMHWMSPIFKMGKSNGRQWDVPDLQPAMDPLDGLAIEKLVSALPVKHRAAIRWSYVYKWSPIQEARSLAVSMDGLEALVRTGRIMLTNRLREIV